MSDTLPLPESIATLCDCAHTATAEVPHNAHCKALLMVEVERLRAALDALPHAYDCAYRWGLTQGIADNPCDCHKANVMEDL